MYLLMSQHESVTVTLIKFYDSLFTMLLIKITVGFYNIRNYKIPANYFTTTYTKWADLKNKYSIS